MSQISKQARSLLLAAPGRVGGSVPAEGSPEDQSSLVTEGLMTPKGNLTIKGFKERSKIAREMEDEAFGE